MHVTASLEQASCRAASHQTLRGTCGVLSSSIRHSGAPVAC
jgi:hypothetical protein